MKNNLRRYKLLLFSRLLLSAVMPARLRFILLMAGGLSGVEASFAQINSDSLIEVYTQKMHKYLDKENSAADIFVFTKAGIEVYAPATDTTQKKFEYGFLWNEMGVVKAMLSESDAKTILKTMKGKSDPFSDEQRKKIPVHSNSSKDTANPSAEKPLKGLRIALDPGHIAGDLETAKMEKKWVEMKANPLRGIKENIQLIEGELTLATAKILKKKLEFQGATVMLTRDKPNISAFGIDFRKWKDSLFHKSLDSAYARGDVSFEEKTFLLKRANDMEIFRRFFVSEELKERARKINAFHPDLTLIIHYNVDETNQNWNKPTRKDFVMTFVGGSFAKDELDDSESRVEFLRLLLTDDLERSIEFSKSIVNSLSEKLEVPAALDSCAIYLRDNCITTGVNGVFCRNLTLTRTVKGTLCYGESLYQDNINECKLLSKKDASTSLSMTLDGIQTSKRVEEVAEAYFQGIMNYVKNKNK